MVTALDSELTYTGKKQPKLGERDPTTQRPLSPYLPSEDLIEVVNLAIFLERPLLLKGEPGCGKTCLAQAVAYELGLPFEAWYVKSTSQAKNGLYSYDAVGRLRDSQLAANKLLISEKLLRINDPMAYIRWGPLGKAFQSERRSVVLIDEIDKADIDFPNDLLLELDELRFVVEELDHEIEATFPPIVFITSNDEKDLPDAFLRRCLFHYVEFPDHERLVMILQSMFPETSVELTDRAIDRFLKLRCEMQATGGITMKMASTSELIDWFRVLKRFPKDEALSKLDGKLPFGSVLIKSWEGHQRYLRQSGTG
ncbi:atpase [Leptolyngbya sp. Heron Island J]|uniref:AAA family ATPase n=1 Tax=Leptolyngbya sp. Heron Island J TaxID=1385935 RepID=UPI0003B9A92E|nr:MoxR family ATPase [Leptolyngbya sp. Heron Island J]ESA34526.1 atpase [Leptolyngbya sp. Heron Island J]